MRHSSRVRWTLTSCVLAVKLCHSQLPPRRRVLPAPGVEIDCHKNTRASFPVDLSKLQCLCRSAADLAASSHTSFVAAWPASFLLRLYQRDRLLLRLQLRHFSLKVIPSRDPSGQHSALSLSTANRHWPVPCELTRVHRTMPKHQCRSRMSLRDIEALNLVCNDR